MSCFSTSSINPGVDVDLVRRLLRFLREQRNASFLLSAHYLHASSLVLWPDRLFLLEVCVPAECMLPSCLQRFLFGSD